MSKVDQVRAWLLEQKYDGLLLGRRDNYAWISQGADNHVLSCCETGVAYYVITQETIELVADSSDSLRMWKEENPLVGNRLLVPWYESMEVFWKKYMGAKRYASDTGVAGTACVQEALIEMRLALSEMEAKRYEEIGHICAQLVESTCKEARAGQTELEIANILKCSCIKQGISPDCVLVGADSRILDYRHPMPTNQKIGRSLMVVLGGQKHGLHISMTRIVYWGEIPEEIKQRYIKTQYIFACMQTMMKQGLSYQIYFEQLKALYKAAGYQEEWRLHHQGGPTGYGCREFVVTPDSEKVIRTGQAYAWNPTIQGTKCEETTFLGEQVLKTFTNTGEWPRTKVLTPAGIFDVADILCKNI